MLISEEVQVVQDLLDSIASGDGETFSQLQTPAVIWDVDGNVAPIAPNTTQIVDIIPFAGTWYAPEGSNLIERTTNDFFEQLQGSLDISQLEPLDFFQDDEQVVVRANLEAVVQETSLPLDLDLIFIVDLDESADGTVQVDNVQVKYHTLAVSRAFAGQMPSSEVIENTTLDPLTGESLSIDPNADSQESLAVVQDAYSDFLAGDLVSFSEAFAEDSVFVVDSDPEFLPQSGVWEGPEGVIEGLTSEATRGLTPTVFVPRFIANGDRVVVTGQQLGVANETGIDFDNDGVQLLTVEDGLIQSWQVLINDYTSASAVAGEPLFIDSEPSATPIESDSLESEFEAELENTILEAGLDFDDNLAPIFAGAENYPVDPSQTNTEDNQVIGSGDDIIDPTTDSDNNLFDGQAGNDTFFLGTSDRLLGSDGDDTFFVTNGSNNKITGGAGADAFWMATGEFVPKANIITNFELGTDVIGVAGIGTTSIEQLEFTQADNNAVISFSDFDLATLYNTSVNDLQTSDAFVFG